jgi:hypothetical protein
MKKLIKIILVTLITVYQAYCQQLDTLRVLVLSPNRVDVCKECRAEYESRNNILIKNRATVADAKRKEKEGNQEQYKQQPNYTRQMFENDLAFIDSLTLGNYVSYVAREFIAYRLYKPYKIKPRLVLLTTRRLVSNSAVYAEKTAETKADFILNFPLITVKKAKQGLVVTTLTELYSSKQKAIIIKSESTGSITESSITDYPMCEQGQLDCAFVNSVYKSIYQCITAIAESRK